MFKIGSGQLVNGLMHRFVLSLVSGATLVTSASWVTLSAQNDTVGVHGVVTTVPAGGLIRKPANFFDLEGTTVTFRPNDAGKYAVTVGNLDWRDPGPGTATRFAHWSGHLAVDLPFPFPFAGRTWTRVYANVNGNISFQRPERMNWPHRDPWASGTMRSVAAAIDSRSAAGLEAMIAVVWAFYGDTTISVDSTPDRVVITWRAFRRTAVNAFYEALGENLFQARLYPSGVIELAYRAVPERDGIVGLFHGLNAGGHILHAVDDAVGDVAHAVLDITKAELVDNGSTLLARMTFAEDVPEQVVRSAIAYQVIIRFGDTRCAAGIEVDADGRRPFADWCGPQPSVVGYRVRGRTIEIPISKTLLNGADHFSWQAGAVWWDEDFDDTQRHTVHVGEPDYDLRALSGTITGNVFEVFHYPTVPKHRLDRVLSYIYQRAPANDEIAVTFTDFRMDDLFSSGGGTGPVNAPVQGIGEWQANPTWGERYASDKLLTSMMPVFIGAPNFNETGVSNGRQYRAFSPGIRWIAHEAVHRWAASLSFRHPRTGRIEDLLDDYCRCHWSNYLHAPAAYPVWPSYSSEPYSEASVMGGAVWLDNGDGSFTRVDNSYPLATGLSALDLYVMGMIPPSEVPDTFLLRDVQETDTRDTVRATKVPIRIEDIVAVMGPRVPAAGVSRKEFRLGVYLLHEEGRPPRSDLLERARGVSAAIPEYFARATGGRMRVVPTVTPPMTGPVVPGGSESFPISAVTPYSLTVEWTEPENTGSAIIDYDVRYREVGSGGDFTDARHEGTARTATLTGLSPGTAYEVQVRATNATGTGPWSELGEVRTSPQQRGDHIYYFPHLAVGASWQTTITYINYSPQEVSCQTEFLSDQGSPLMVSFAGLGRVVSRSDVLPPGGSVHQETNVELSAPLAPGWALANCSGPVKASLLFRGYDSEGLPVAEAGVNAAAVPATRFVTFAEQGEGQFGTGVAYANPSATAAHVTFTARDADGQILASTDRTLLPGGHDAQGMASLFGLSSFTGSLEVTSTVPIVSLALNFEVDPVFSSLPPGEVDAAAQGATTYYFPHLAVGASWQTTITYINYSSQQVSCTTEFISDHGSPLLVSFADRGTVVSRSDVLPAGGSVHQETNVDLSAPLAPGWAQTTCSGPVKASLLFRQHNSAGVPVAEAGVNATRVAATRFVTFAEQGEGKSGTGVAYANPSATAAHVTFTARDTEGQVLASVVRTLLPEGHDAQNMASLFGLPSFSGSLEITSTEPIVSLSLNFEAAPVFSSLPPGETPSGGALAPTSQAAFNSLFVGKVMVFEVLTANVPGAPEEFRISFLSAVRAHVAGYSYDWTYEYVSTGLNTGTTTWRTTLSGGRGVVIIMQLTFTTTTTGTATGSLDGSAGPRILNFRIIDP